jgi:hypothetical protein
MIRTHLFSTRKGPIASASSDRREKVSSASALLNAPAASCPAAAPLRDNP